LNHLVHTYIHTHTHKHIHTHIHKHKISEGIASKQNKDYTSQGTRFTIKEEKLQVFDRKLVQEMWKTANNTHFEGGTEELDKYLSTMIRTENDLEHQVDLFSEAVQSAC